jgi:hypothetical protein
MVLSLERWLRGRGAASASRRTAGGQATKCDAPPLKGNALELWVLDGGVERGDVDRYWWST